MAAQLTPRDLVTALVSSMSVVGPDLNHEQVSNPLKDVPTSIQKALLTLHVLFPNELLPALDLLDRGLVTLSKVSRHPSKEEGEDSAQHGGRAVSGIPTPAEHATRTTKVYYVRSGQSQSRHRTAVNHTASYEVRLEAWSCSCPAFAFSAFPTSAATPSGDVDRGVIDEQIDDSRAAPWRFGGLTLGTDMPVCKHLLACLLVEHCSIFAAFVEEREVSVEDLAGWAAGWGD